MSTSELGDGRIEAARNRAASRSFGQGILIGLTAGALIAMACAVVLNPAFSAWLNRRAAANDDDRRAAQREDEADRLAKQPAEDQPDEQGAMRLVNQQGVGDEEQDDVNQPDASDGEPVEAVSIEKLAQEFATFRKEVDNQLFDIEAKLATDANQSDDFGGGTQQSLEQFKREVLKRLDQLDERVVDYDQVGSVDDFPTTEMRQDRAELDQAQRTTAQRPAQRGTLVLNNTTGVEGYVYVNEEPVRLTLGRNEIETALGEVVIRIPNGGVTYRLDDALWQLDADGNYVMNRPSWPPTAP